jgi:Mce-associated membrane protein
MNSSAHDVDDSPAALTEEAGEGSAALINPDDDQNTAGDIAEPESQPASAKRRFKWKSVLTYGLLPALALILALAAGFLKFVDASARDAHLAGTQSVQAASDGAIAMLSYHPDTVEKDLTAARGRLTGSFQDSYTALIRDVVIPGAKQKQVAAAATVPAAASVAADQKRAVVLIFVDQAITVGNDSPTSTSSTVRVSLDKIDGRWLISAFDPI